MKTGVYRPAHEDYTRYSKIMSFYFKEAIQNKISVSKALVECTNSIRTDRLMIKEF